MTNNPGGPGTGPDSAVPASLLYTESLERRIVEDCHNLMTLPAVSELWLQAKKSHRLVELHARFETSQRKFDRLPLFGSALIGK